MKKYVVLLLICGHALAKPKLEVNENVEQFKRKYLSNTALPHRSSLVGKEDSLDTVFKGVGKLSSQKNEETQENPRDAIAQYQIKYDSTVFDLLSGIRKKSSVEFKFDKYYEDSKEFSSSAMDDTASLAFRSDAVSSINELVQTADKFIDASMPFFKGRIEYENYEEERINGQLNKLNVRYRRIFKGRIVRDNIAYLYVIVSADNRILGVIAKWPSFKQTQSIRDISIHQAYNEAYKFYENFPDIRAEGATHIPKKKSIDGVALSWKLNKTGESMTPAVSFLGAVNYENDLKLTPIFDYSGEFK